MKLQLSSYNHLDHLPDSFAYQVLMPRSHIVIKQEEERGEGGGKGEVGRYFLKSAINKHKSIIRISN